MKQKPREERGRKSIFRSLFIPLFLIMILQAGIFYFAAVYGGIEESLNQNASDILSERLINRKNEIETRFNGKWTSMDSCSLELGNIYAEYEKSYGSQPLTNDKQRQIRFLSDSAEILIDTLRHNEVNGIFLILNDQSAKESAVLNNTKQKYGLCIRDMDQDSNYFEREDLLLERAPSSIVDSLGCSLDSWWEAWYSFESKEQGDYYYRPLDAAWENEGAKGQDLAYVSEVYRLSGSDPAMIAYSIPLISEEGYPYGVIGIEIATKYLASLMPNKELNEADKCCYVLAQKEFDSNDCLPIIGTGALYNRCFGSGSVISCEDTTSTGGFLITGRGNTELYGNSAQLKIYNSNNPFENRQLTLIALVESDTLFAYIGRVKFTLMAVSIISLMLGIVWIALISRRFAAPITALADRVCEMEANSDFRLGRLGITEIDQLVDSIETLNRNVSKNSARTEFFSRMSHDMRTPMNAIISFSSPEMLEDATEEVKDDYLKKINASGGYLLGLINEVLDMTKIESNKTELHFETMPANRLLETIIPIIEKLASEKSVFFSSNISADPDVYVMADKQHVDQIVMNLLSNAVKFTPPKGRVSLKVKTSFDGEDPEQINCRIVVSDTGIGVSEDFMKHLYTPFEQENSGQEGTGLGLSIAKKLVELMNGSIDCVSQKNIGTTFTVNIPLLKGKAEESSEKTAAGYSAGKNFKALEGKRILVCEDNDINLQIICNLLEKKKIIVKTAPNGEDGLAAFASSETGEFDAVLMDIQMPVMNGLSAAKAIRALDRADADKVAIIAMTANAFEEDVRASEEAGMNMHLTKPIEPQKLYDTLLHFLG